jgi:divalent metal cation (Fe/Co/Zn/Cd) transporter
MRTAIRLVVATMAYNSLEAVIALWSGVAAGSIALVGFGLDSIIELAAAAVLFWRLRKDARGADADTVERTELQVRHFVD